MKQVTIVVPIYNVEKYLVTCFESLLKQTSNEYQIYAINDGSPDHSDEIIHEYAKQYPDKIIEIQKENGGYGSVLELAIQKMDTPYFLICDPDDTITENALETLLEMARISDADIAIGAKTFIYENSTDRDYDKAYNDKYTELVPSKVYHREDADFQNLFFVDPSPHAKLYRTSIAKDIVFPHKVGYTDNLLFYMSLLNSKKVIYTNQSLANYLVDRAGNTMTDIRPRAINGQIQVFQTIVKEALEKREVPNMFWYRMFESFKYILYQTRRLACTKEEYREVLKNLGEFLKLLVPYGSVIRPLYLKYTDNAIVEKLRDVAMMNTMFQQRVYQSICNKMIQEFQPKED